MKSKPGFGVSLLLWVIIGLGFLAYWHWPIWPSSGANNRSDEVVKSPFVYLQDVSRQVNDLAAKQPAFGALMSKMRVNLADIHLQDMHAKLTPTYELSVELKNRTEGELAWLDAHSNTPSDVFIDGDDPRAGLYIGKYQCVSLTQAGFTATACPMITATDWSPVYMNGAYSYSFDAVTQHDLCGSTYENAHVAECLRSAPPSSWRVTVADGTIRVYGSANTFEDTQAVASLIFQELRFAVTAMSVDWRTAFDPIRYRLLPCAFAPSCTNQNDPNDGLVHEALTLQYVEATPVFENWGGDELERRLAARYATDSKYLAGNHPEYTDSGGSVGPTFEAFVHKNKDFFYAHPSWFVDHPLWTVRIQPDLHSLNYQIPHGPLNDGDISRMLTALHIDPADGRNP